jgi:hypothetical protein
MTIQTSFHARAGAEFLGLRLSRRGQIEVVYDNGLQDRHVWCVVQGGQRLRQPSPADEARISDALRIAAHAPRVLHSLHAEMKKRALTLETAPD